MKEPFLAIKVLGLNFRYKDGAAALRGVDFSVRAGEKICIAGANGAGKSTLLLCLAGLLRAEGSIALEGREICVPMKKNIINPAVFGLVFQHPDDQLFCPTVGEDVAFGPKNMKVGEGETQKRVIEALNGVNLEGYGARNAHFLSGGEKKRAAIASVLSCKPSIMALDEPWANLDARASRSVSSVLSIFSGTLLIATHELARASRVCDRMIILDNGRIAADGIMRDLLEDKALLSRHGLE